MPADAQCPERRACYGVGSPSQRSNIAGASVCDRLTVAAVATARVLGARRFRATVQEVNVGLFALGVEAL